MQSKEEVYYYFNLGWRDDYFEDDGTFHDGYRAGGTLTIYVNDSPVSMYSRNGQVYRITPFLKNGRNSIRVAGKHSKRIWLKVALANPKELMADLKMRKVLSKTWLEPEKDSVSLEFDAQVSGSPEFEELGSNPETRALRETELRQLVDQLLTACANHDADSFNNALLPALNAPPEYAKHRSELLKSQDRLAEMVNNRKQKLLTTPADLKIIYGARSVVLYSGEQEGPCFLNFDTGDKHSLAWMDPVTLVRIDGKWTQVEEIKRFPLSFGI